MTVSDNNGFNKKNSDELWVLNQLVTRYFSFLKKQNAKIGTMLQLIAMRLSLVLSIRLSLATNILRARKMQKFSRNFIPITLFE